MDEMSPLSRFILIAMLWGLRFSAVSIAAIFALELWRRLSAPAVDMTSRDYGFLAVLIGLFVAALWFARSVATELRK